MNKQIRQSVFETNSSSSHSLTMGKATLLAQPFPANVLRSGIVTLKVGEYGWEYRRYYTTQSKLNYLLTQVTGGQDIPTGEPADNARELALANKRVEMLFRVVKEHTGCDVEVETSSGYIDHDSVGVGVDLFNNEDELRAFLFDDTAYVETSNDNSPGPWSIMTDKGSDLFYERFIREVPDDYEQVTLTKVGQYGIEAFGTSVGGIVGPHHEPELHKALSQYGVVAHVHFDCVDTQDPYSRNNRSGEAADAVIRADDEDGEVLLHVSRDFDTSHTFTQCRGYSNRHQDMTLKVWVPPTVAARLSALPAGGVARYNLDYAQRLANLWDERVKEAVADGKPDNWSSSQAEHYKAEVAKYQAQLSA